MTATIHHLARSTVPPPVTGGSGGPPRARTTTSPRRGFFSRIASLFRSARPIGPEQSRPAVCSTMPRDGGAHPPARPVRQIRPAPPSPTLADYAGRRAAPPKRAPRISEADTLRAMLRGLTWADHMEFCRATGADPDLMWDFAMAAAPMTAATPAQEAVAA